MAATIKKQTGAKQVFGDGTPGPGRKPGVPNKVTRELKEMILAALDNAGGEKYLAQQAIENPTAFMTLVGKVLPLTVNANVKATVALVQALPLDDSL